MNKCKCLLFFVLCYFVHRLNFRKLQSSLPTTTLQTRKICYTIPSGNVKIEVTKQNHKTGNLQLFSPNSNPRNVSAIYSALRVDQRITVRRDLPAAECKGERKRLRIEGTN